MTKKYFIIGLLFFSGTEIWAQVGIGNINPTGALEVTGDVLVRKKLFLKDPGEYLNEPNAHFLVMKDSDASTVKYDISNSSYGPMNQVTYVFNNTASTGLDNFNTKIDATKYTLVVHGVTVERNGSLIVMLRSNSNYNGVSASRLVQGHQYYAFVQSGTWRLRAIYNDSSFYDSTGRAKTQVDITMDVTVYRNNFITKVFPSVQTIDMGKSETKSVSLPAGF